MYSRNQYFEYNGSVIIICILKRSVLHNNIVSMFANYDEVIFQLASYGVQYGIKSEIFNDKCEACCGYGACKLYLTANIRNLLIICNECISIIKNLKITLTTKVNYYIKSQPLINKYDKGIIHKIIFKRDNNFASIIIVYAIQYMRDISHTVLTTCKINNSCDICHHHLTNARNPAHSYVCEQCCAYIKRISVLRAFYLRNLIEIADIRAYIWRFMIKN
jgi:hypothetical protein